jgi:hypothetical protein
MGSYGARAFCFIFFKKQRKQFAYFKNLSDDINKIFKEHVNVCPNQDLFSFEYSTDNYRFENIYTLWSDSIVSLSKYKNSTMWNVSPITIINNPSEIYGLHHGTFPKDWIRKRNHHWCKKDISVPPERLREEILNELREHLRDAQLALAQIDLLQALNESQFTDEFHEIASEAMNNTIPGILLRPYPEAKSPVPKKEEIKDDIIVNRFDLLDIR